MKKIVLFIFIIVISSCNKIRDNYPQNKISVEVNIAKKINLSDFSHNIEYIRLRSNDSIFIGNIAKMISIDNQIFIFDDKVNRILIYNKNGEFKAQINKTGRGPGESLSILDFLVDSINKSIEIWDNGNRKIIKYDYTGNFLNERSLPLPNIANFGKFSDNSYVLFAGNHPNFGLSEDNPNNIFMIDSSNNVQTTFLPINNLKFLRLQIPNGLVQYRDGFNLTIPFDNNIYHITQDKCIAAYKLEFLNYAIPVNLFKNYKKLLKQDDQLALSKERRYIMNEINKKGYATGIENIFENEKIFFFQFFLTKQGTFSVFFNKETMETRTGIPDNDIDYGLFGQPVSLVNDTLFTIIQAGDLIKKVNDVNSDSLRNLNHNFIELKNICNSMSEFENPILAKFTLSVK